MALIDRNGRSYYIKSVRRNGRVTSEYQGSGMAAVMKARMDKVRRTRREAADADWRAERKRLEAEDRTLDELCTRVEIIVRAALGSRGSIGMHGDSGGDGA
jgi:hypothetical protein